MRAVAALLVLTLAACSADAATDRLTANLDEWNIELSSETFRPGEVSITVQNAGEFAHTLVVEASDGTVVAATEVIAPGDASDLDLILDGTGYRFTCRIVASGEDGAVVDHFEEGMAAAVNPG